MSSQGKQEVLDVAAAAASSPVVPQTAMTETGWATWLMTKAGFPLFVAYSALDDVREIAATLGASFYYALTLDEMVYNKTLTTIGPRLYKFISTPYATAQIRADVAEFTTEYPVTKPAANYYLPRIPWPIVRKIDTFFRAVDDKLHTEATVLICFDPRKEGSDGFCIFVPEQKNTGGSCEYEPTSIIDEKDDEIMIIGTAHSHPGMKAYASGTDHHDQAEFDGLHITFGWTGKRDTEFHFELQIGGFNFTLTEAQVFDLPDQNEELPDVEDWVKKVSKKSLAVTHYGPNRWWGWSSGWRDRLPLNVPHPDDVTLAVSLLENEKTCPVCKVELIAVDVENRRCGICRSFFMMHNENFKQLQTHRVQMGSWASDDLIPEKARRPIYIWGRIMKERFVSEIVLFYDPPGYKSNVRFGNPPGRSNKHKGGGKGKGDAGESPAAVSSALCWACGTAVMAPEVECSYCTADIDWAWPICNGCGVIYPGNEINSCPNCKAVLGAVDSNASTEDSNDELDDDDIVYANYCCDKPPNECQCEAPIATNIDCEELEGAFNVFLYSFTTTQCRIHCRHYKEPTCRPLRQKIKEIVETARETKEFPRDFEKITGCDDYFEDMHSPPCENKPENFKSIADSWYEANLQHYRTMPGFF